MGNDHEEPVYTLDDALVAVGFGKFQYLVLVYAGLGSTSEAMEVMILAFLGPSVKSEWDLSSTQESIITTVIFAGMLIGAYLWGLVSDNFGRRTGLLSVAVLTSGAGFLTAFSPNYVSLVILVFLLGIGLGGGSVYSSWFLEFVPAPNRGTWMVIYSTFWTVGTVVEASLAWIIMPRMGWRWMLALSSLPAFAALLFYGLTPESPRFLCMNGQTADAHNILKRVAQVNQKDLPYGMLISDHMTTLDEQFAPLLEETNLLKPAANEKLVSKTGFSTLRMLFSSKLRTTSLLLWMVFFSNSFSYYGIILLTSELNSEQSKCSSNLLTDDSSQHQDATHFKDIFVTSLAELPGLVLAAVIVDWIGRKLSMLLMFMLGCIFLLPLALHQHEIVTTVLLFGARMVIVGTFTVANIYAPEIYPTSVRATGVGVASAVGNIGGMVSPLVAVGLITGCHQTAAIFVFVVVIFLSGLSVLFLPIETMGQELNDRVTLHQQNYIYT